MTMTKRRKVTAASRASRFSPLWTEALVSYRLSRRPARTTLKATKVNAHNQGCLDSHVIDSAALILSCQDRGMDGGMTSIELAFVLLAMLVLVAGVAALVPL
jgi:hypothetical protein